MSDSHNLKSIDMQFLAPYASVSFLKGLAWLILFLYPIAEGFREVYISRMSKESEKSGTNNRKRKLIDRYLYISVTILACTTINQNLFLAIILATAVTFYRWAIMNGIFNLVSNKNFLGDSVFAMDGLDQAAHNGMVPVKRLRYLSFNFMVFSVLYFFLACL